ncbi:hypothetical protein FACS189472_14980 [Alphaproteobacteria bacterium]|nr:hypothetical protein FACS189472_14980 [Alphaproteobacteria bacterium]
MRPILKALAPLIEVRRIEYKSKKRDYKIALREFEDQQTFDEPRKPILRQLLINDTTIEAIHKAIDPDNPECICVYRDELSGLIGAISKYSDGDRSFYLEGYNGNFYVINRSKYDEPIVIPKLSLSIFGSIQPQKLSHVLNGADDGFSSRILFAFPEPIITEEPELDVTEETLRTIFRKLDQLPAKEEKIRLSKKAREIFNQWHMENELQAQNYTTGLLQSSYGKMGGQVARLSCVLEHILWTLSAEISPPTEISEQNMLRGIALIEDYFKPMVKKVFSKCSRGENDEIAQVFVKYLTDHNVSKFNLRELKRNNMFPDLNNENAEKSLISILVEANIVKHVASDSKGRPSKNYIVNPQLMEEKI